MEINKPNQPVNPPETPTQPVLNPVNNKKSFFPIILGVLLLFVLVGGGAYYLGKQNSRTNQASNINTKPTPTQIFISSLPTITSAPDTTSINSSTPMALDIRSLLKSLQQTINENTPMRDGKSVDWVDDTKRIVPLAGVYIDFSLDHQPDVFTFFLNHGFMKSTLNDRTVTISTYYGYTLKDIKCLVTAYSGAIPPSGDVFCGKLDQTEMVWRTELAPLVDPNNDPSIVWSVDKLVGNYATGISGDGAAGAHWIAEKVNGQWKQIWIGQNVISCKTVQEYNIPKEIYNACDN